MTANNDKTEPEDIPNEWGKDIDMYDILGCAFFCLVLGGILLIGAAFILNLAWKVLTSA